MQSKLIAYYDNIKEHTCLRTSNIARKVLSYIVHSRFIYLFARAKGIYLPIKKEQFENENKLEKLNPLFYQQGQIMTILYRKINTMQVNNIALQFH